VRQSSAKMANILGVEVANNTSNDLLRPIEAAILAGEGGCVFNANAHSLNLFNELTWLRDCFSRAEMIFPDGHGA